MRHGSVFTGAGLLDYGLMLAGFDAPIWVAEWDEWRREYILAQRFPDAVRYGDVRSIGAECEPVECMAGGFPCKGASTAGLRNGFDHPETVLWREFARAIGELRPRYVLVENVANILALHDGAVWGEVLGDLAALGYDTVWDCLPAAAVGAPHLRDRVFAIATHTASGDGQGSRRQREALGRTQADAPSPSAHAAGEHQRDAHNTAHAIAGGGNARQVPDFGAAVAQAVADPGCAGRQERDGANSDGGAAQPAGSQRRGESQGAGVPLAVEWGEYEPAIRRWESAFGRPAGEPLLSGVVARSARGLVRSRLSALGDGVQVQVGAIAGAYILEREASRMNTPAFTRKDGPA